MKCDNNLHKQYRVTYFIFILVRSCVTFNKLHLILIFIYILLPFIIILELNKHVHFTLSLRINALLSMRQRYNVTSVVLPVVQVDTPWPVCLERQTIV